MAKFNYGFTSTTRNKFRGGLGGRARGTGGTRGPRPGASRRGFMGGGGFRFGGGGRFRGAFSVDFTLDYAKSFFFDRNDWDHIFEPAEKRVLNRAGALVRLAAQGQIRKRKKESRPGQSPTRWAERWGGVDPRTGKRKSNYAALTNIAYAIDPWSKSVIIGPIFIGSTHRKVYTFPQPTIPATLEFGGSERVGYASLTRRGEFLPKNRVVHIAARPYMAPALEKKRHKILELFRNMLGLSPASMAVTSNLRHAG